MKKLLIPILLITIAILIFLLSKKDREEGIIKEEVSPEVVEVGLENENSTSIFNKQSEETYSEETENFIATIKYPSFGDATIDREIEDFIMEDLKDFKENNDISFENSVAKNNYEVKYEIPSSKNYQSIIFTIYEFTGGAHGNIRIKTLNYTKSGTKISLGSLFKPDSEYLSSISLLSRDKLKEEFKDLDPVWIDDGTEPISSNFSAFFLEGDNKLKIIFQPYQIGPWVIGTPNVSIDLENELQEIYLNN